MQYEDKSQPVSTWISRLTWRCCTSCLPLQAYGLSRSGVGSSYMLCCQEVPRRGCCCWLRTHFENLWFRTCQKEGVFRLWVLGCEADLVELILWAAESYWWDGGAGHGLICISKRSCWCSVGEWILGTGIEAGR